MAILDKVFKTAMKNRASDIHVVPQEPFILRRFGKLIKLKNSPLTPKNTMQVITEILTPEQKDILEKNMQLDFCYEIPGTGRFRGSVMAHNNGYGAVFRTIAEKIPVLSELGLPDTLYKMLENHQGLILVTGASGHGKSTTLAAMIDHINTNKALHILTVEDPIEFVHPLKKGVVNQRQLNTGTLSYSNALKGALREDPDIIMIGELRDLDTVSLAISAAETGHLVLGTLATSSGPKTIDRIIDAYPPDEQCQIRAMLSESLKAVITQRLIPAIDEKSMVLASEILIGSMPLANLIRDEKTFQIHSLMQTSKNIGMQIMDEHIMELLEEGKITPHNAYINSNENKLFESYLDKKSD